MGKLVSTYGTRKIMFVSLPLLILGMLLVASGMARGNLPVLLVGMLFTGFGQGLGFGPLTSLGVWEAKDYEAGVASGVVNTAHQMGGTLGIALLMSLLDAYGSYANTLVATASLMVLAAITIYPTMRKIVEDSRPSRCSPR